MRNLILKILSYFIYWVLFFQLGRVVFFILTKSFAANFGFKVITESMLHGVWLDASVASYFSIFYCLLTLVGLIYPKSVSMFFSAWHALLLGVCSLSIISNAVLYKYWATPLDYNALKYLDTPKEAMASINWLYMIGPLGLGIALFIVFKVSSNSLNFSRFKISEAGFKRKIWSVVLVLSFAMVLIVPLRGGIGIVPINLSKVYFHPEIYPNHAAYNPVWNIAFSIANNSAENKYSFMDESIAMHKFNALHNFQMDTLEDQWIVKKGKPNVIVIVLESYLSKLVKFKYKGVEVIPYFNYLTEHGIYFNQLYASGDRSDKGLLSIFSGYPAMPKAAMAQFPERFSSLPSVFKDTKAAGYSTSFYYGGNLDFANLRSYFIASGVQNIHSDEDFSKAYPRGKWGVHDAYVLSDFMKDLKSMPQPFFSAVFTLSNHEPYDLPVSYSFGQKNEDEEYMSAANYTDTNLGLFMETLKKTSLWENTLVVLVADHGVNRLGIHQIFDPERFHIPMIWTGGMVTKPQIVDRICSQTDISKAILHQCSINQTVNYKFSNAIDYSNTMPFATYFFNNGFGFITPDCQSFFDNVTRKYWENSCGEEINGVYGKAYLQVLSKDFND